MRLQRLRGKAQHTLNAKDVCGVKAEPKGVGLDTPLHAAAQRGDEAQLLWWLNKSEWINCGNEEGKTPLHLAVENGFDSVGLQLLRKNANYHLVTKTSQLTILDIVCREGLVQCARFIIEEMSAAYLKKALPQQLEFECQFGKFWDLAQKMFTK